MSKTKDYLKELRNKNLADLEKELVNNKKELFNLRFQVATNQLENNSRIRLVRRNIARVKTIMTQVKNKEEA